MIGIYSFYWDSPAILHTLNDVRAIYLYIHHAYNTVHCTKYKYEDYIFTFNNCTCTLFYMYMYGDYIYTINMCTCMIIIFIHSICVHVLYVILYVQLYMYDDYIYIQYVYMYDDYIYTFNMCTCMMILFIHSICVHV